MSPLTKSTILRCIALVLLAACGSSPDARAPRDTSLASNATANPQTATSSRPIAIEHSASRDLTGDGVPERLVLHAAGGRTDSLAIVLEIRDGKSGTLLHRARWSSRDYFKYEPADGTPDDAARDALVRRNLDRVFADSAFVAPRTTLPDGRTEAVDTSVVRYALLELDWRRVHGIADSMPTPPAAETELGRPRVTDAALRARTAAVGAELRGRPTFTVFQGGELTNTIAWSDREHAFVRVFSCC
ncbi:MAG: hypothetical protein ABI601_18060 [bacterium]